MSLLDCDQELWSCIHTSIESVTSKKWLNGTVGVVVVFQSGRFSLAGRRLICVEKQDG